MFGFIYELADGLRHHARRRKWPAEHALGRRGEDIAHRYLQRAGMVVVARNYRSAGGAEEIDLVGWDHGTLVFVEVKSRSTEDYGSPDRAIDPIKQQHMIRAARRYARHAEAPWETVRFDVVTVIFGAPPEVTHYKDVFKPARPVFQDRP